MGISDRLLYLRTWRSCQSVGLLFFFILTVGCIFLAICAICPPLATIIHIDSPAAEGESNVLMFIGFLVLAAFTGLFCCIVITTRELLTYNWLLSFQIHYLSNKGWAVPQKQHSAWSLLFFLSSQNVLSRNKRREQKEPWVLRRCPAGQRLLVSKIFMYAGWLAIFIFGITVWAGFITVPLVVARSHNDSITAQLLAWYLQEIRAHISKEYFEPVYAVIQLGMAVLFFFPIKAIQWLQKNDHPAETLRGYLIMVIGLIAILCSLMPLFVAALFGFTVAPLTYAGSHPGSAFAHLIHWYLKWIGAHVSKGNVLPLFISIQGCIAGLLMYCTSVFRWLRTQRQARNIPGVKT